MRQWQTLVILMQTQKDDVDKIFEKAYESYDNPEYDEIEPDFD